MISRRSAAIQTLCLVVLGAFAVPASPSASDDKAITQQARDLLSHAKDLVDIRGAGSSPFRMQARVRISKHRGEFAEGAYVLEWASPDRFRAEFTLPGYSELDVAQDGKIWRKRPYPFLPLQMWQLNELLNMSLSLQKVSGHIKGAEVRPSKSHGERMTCAEVTEEWGITRVCLDEARNVPVFVDTNIPTETRREEYSDYQPLGPKLFPRTLRQFFNGKLMVEVNVSEMEELPAGYTLPTDVPPGVTPESWCSDMIEAKMIEGAQQFPHAINADGAVCVYGVVGVDGKIRNTHVVESVNPDLDQEVLQAVLNSRFKPATCGGSPVGEETIIRFSFKSQ